MTTVPHPSAKRGDTFDRVFNFGNDWEFTDFTGGVWFTLRSKAPSSAIEDDSDAITSEQCVAADLPNQARARVEAADTRVWPTGELFYELRGFVTGSLVAVLRSGPFIVSYDLTRDPH